MAVLVCAALAAPQAPAETKPEPVNLKNKYFKKVWSYRRSNEIF